MSKIAIDVALLPPENILEELVGINRELITNKQEIILNKDSYLPHCTIAMGVIDTEKIPEFWNKIINLSKTISPIRFQANKIETRLRSDGITKISSIDSESNPQLQEFHERVMALAENYLTTDATLAMFIQSPFLNELSSEYIRKFWSKNSRQGYRPHITLGLGEPKNAIANFDFSLSRLALCQCGAYTTCAKILFETTLKT